MIDLVGRAAERLDLNATDTPTDKVEPWLTETPETPETPPSEAKADAKLEPTILASLAGEETISAPAPPPSPPPEAPFVSTEPSIIMAAAEKEFTAAQKERERTAEISLANHISINWTALEENGYLSPNNQQSLKAEEFRIIKRPLLRAAFNPEGRHKSIAHVAMVTSPCPKDGKTFTSINLAVSIASERDLHVLLIDADIRNRGLSKTLGLADRPGLMELLTKPDMNVPAVFLRTDIGNLAVIPAGQPIPGATEIFASQAMARLARDIATRYANRFIIFDAPPVLASSEPGVLASHVGQIVMVVRANETAKRAINQAVSLVTACPTVNFVLNQISLAAGPDRFGYYGTEDAPEARA
jgi:receptor protein-tyrosine kinase